MVIVCIGHKSVSTCGGCHEVTRGTDRVIRVAISTWADINMGARGRGNIDRARCCINRRDRIRQCSWHRLTMTIINITSCGTIIKSHIAISLAYKLLKIEAV